MWMVIFHPKKGTTYLAGWPEKVIGEDFIELELLYSYGDDTTIYRDQFKDEYEFIGQDAGEWTVEVREDG